MKAIFIDPMNQRVDYIDVASGRNISNLIKDHITIAVDYPNGDVLYVGDNSLMEVEPALKGEAEAFRAFYFDVRAHQPFAGYGLIVGMEDENGEITDVRTRVEDIRRIITYLVPGASSATGPVH